MRIDTSHWKSLLERSPKSGDGDFWILKPGRQKENLSSHFYDLLVINIFLFLSENLMKWQKDIGKDVHAKTLRIMPSKGKKYIVFLEDIKLMEQYGSLYLL